MIWRRILKVHLLHGALFLVTLAGYVGMTGNCDRKKEWGWELVGSPRFLRIGGGTTSVEGQGRFSLGGDGGEPGFAPRSAEEAAWDLSLQG